VRYLLCFPIDIVIVGLVGVGRDDNGAIGINKPSGHKVARISGRNACGPTIGRFPRIVDGSTKVVNKLLPCVFSSTEIKIMGV